MSLNHQKELTPVLYDESAVKILLHPFYRQGARCFPPHWHERMEVLFIQNGSLRLQVDKQEVTIQEGELGIIPPTAVHRGIAGEDGVLFRVVMFDVGVFLNSVRGCRRLLTAFLNGETAVSPRCTDPQAARAVQYILETRDARQVTDPLFVTAQIYLLFRQLFLETPPAALPQTTPDERFEDILRYIDTHFKEPLTVASLCGQFGYTESYFCRRFKVVTGMTPVKYITVQRLEEAKRLMDAGAKGVASVSTACGFYDSGYFTRLFKRTYGLTPTRYIALLREERQAGN